MEFKLGVYISKCHAILTDVVPFFMQKPKTLENVEIQGSNVMHGQQFTIKLECGLGKPSNVF